MHNTLVRNIAFLILVGLIILVVREVGAYKEMPEADQADGIIKLILYFIATAVVAGFFFVTYILPMFGDAVGEAMLSSGEESTTDPYLKARGKIAIGDYEAAVREFQAIAEENPEDRMPVAEIVKLYLERLHDPANAELTLENAIAQEHWEPDDAAFFIFRLIDLVQEHQPDDKDRVVNLLQKVMRRYPNTRHAANATHRLREIDPQLVASVQEEIRLEQAAQEAEDHGDVPHPDHVHIEEVEEAESHGTVPAPSRTEPPKPSV